MSHVFRSFVAGLLVVAFVATANCVVLRRPLEIPKTEGPIVMVLSNRLGKPMRRIARHAYIAVREDDQWTIWECCGPGSHGTNDPFRPSFGDEVRLHAVVTGERARKAAACIKPATKKYGNPRYWMWPGPNSNTYVDVVARKCGIPVSLPSTAVGKDFRGVIGASVTSERTGVQLESWFIGLRLGLKEGIQLHLFGLSFGVDFWPPAIITPVGEGRIGFGDR